MLAIWLIIWALHNTPAITNSSGLNAYGVWLCIIGALEGVESGGYMKRRI